MATTPLTPIVSAFDLTTVFQDLFTVKENQKGIGIDAVVFNNYSANSQTFTVRLIESGTSTVLNEIITEVPIRKKGNNLAPAMIGQALSTGGIIQAKASANNSINVNITATVVDN